MVIVEEYMTVISVFEFYGYFKYFKMVVNSMKLVPAKNKINSKKKNGLLYVI